MFEIFNDITIFKSVYKIFPCNSTVNQCWTSKAFVSGMCLLQLLTSSSCHCQTPTKNFSKSDSPTLSLVLTPLIIITQIWGPYSSLRCHLKQSTWPSAESTLSSTPIYTTSTAVYTAISNSNKIDSIRIAHGDARITHAIMLHFLIPGCRQKFYMPDASTLSTLSIMHLLTCCWGRTRFWRK